MDDEKRLIDSILRKINTVHVAGTRKYAESERGLRMLSIDELKALDLMIWTSVIPNEVRDLAIPC